MQAHLLFNQSFARSSRDAKAASVLGRVLEVRGAASTKEQQDPAQVMKDLQHAALVVAPTPRGMASTARGKQHDKRSFLSGRSFF